MLYNKNNFNLNFLYTLQTRKFVYINAKRKRRKLEVYRDHFGGRRTAVRGQRHHLGARMTR